MQTSNNFLPIGSLADRMGASEDWRGESLLLRGRRQALLAGNIANADTPRYQAKDLNFADAMGQALNATIAPKMEVSSDRHFAPETVARPKSTLELAGYSDPSQPSLDNNTVDLDRERAGIAKNSILYQLAMMVYEDELKEFKDAAGDPMMAAR